ncbi:unnamed protein product (mitochondrion) [Plasmodiophora brassicae]|uniref:Uncharacterized protein n=1 Tax=Plasmodiophora brassicae TaxID=37360 RepID=A0A3P3Y6A9_PLABS|nr:unnamed protein product [Plasmodiophora brassicae]
MSTDRPVVSLAMPCADAVNHKGPHRSQAPLIERDPAATRLVHQGPHGLQLIVQLDGRLPVPIPSYKNRERSKPNVNSKCPQQTSRQQHRTASVAPADPHPQQQTCVQAPVGQQSPVAVFVPPVPVPDVAVDEQPAAKRRKAEEPSDAMSSSDRWNRCFEQLEDEDSWRESSQMVLVVLADIMRHVQTMGIPENGNAEQTALHDEISHEVAQIEHLVYNYTASASSSSRRRKTSLAVKNNSL